MKTQNSSLMTEWYIFVDHMFLVLCCTNVYREMEYTHEETIPTYVCTCKRLVIVCAQTNGGYNFSVYPFTYKTTNGLNSGWNEEKTDGWIKSVPWHWASYENPL